MKTTPTVILILKRVSLRVTLVTRVAELRWLCRGQCSISVLLKLVAKRSCVILADENESRDYLGSLHWISHSNPNFTISASSDYPSK